MRMSQLLFKTERDTSSDTILHSHRLLVRAGLIKQLSSGIYSLTPLAQRVMANIIGIAKEEMNRVGGQEILLPIVQPASLWEESGRHASIDASLARLHDRNGQNMVLAMTHEEAVTDLVRSYVRSYRQLPLMVYQVQTKFRDEARPRGGLVRLREFLMKDAYSFHEDANSLDQLYSKMIAAYEAFYARCGLRVLKVESDTGMMGGGAAHEFMVLCDGGEDTLVTCPNCNYAANREVAVARKRPNRFAGDAQPLAVVHTPGVPTVNSLAEYLSCSVAQIVKCVMYVMDDGVPVSACVSGDYEVNEVKLQRLLGTATLRTMTSDEVRKLNLTPGYISPIGFKHQPVRVVADDTLVGCTNMVAGGNREDEHYVNVAYGRDFHADIIGDITVAADGQPCLQCGAALQSMRGIEVGNIFKLGTQYSGPMQANFTDKDGTLRPFVMGCYGIGITRVLACIVEENHDDKGIIWPESVAPYSCHLVVVGSAPETQAAAEALYQRLGVERVLFDDRNTSPGSKLADADLLGMPVRITVSNRSLAAGGAEIKVRRSGDSVIVPLPDVERAIRELEPYPMSAAVSRMGAWVRRSF